MPNVMRIHEERQIIERLLRFHIIKLEICAVVANNKQELPATQLDVRNALRLEFGVDILFPTKRRF